MGGGPSQTQEPELAMKAEGLECVFLVASGRKVEYNRAVTIVIFILPNREESGT